MTEPTRRGARASRLLFAGAGLLALGAAACNSSSSADSPSSSTIAATTAVPDETTVSVALQPTSAPAVESTVAPAPAPAPAPIAAPVDGAALLSSALATLTTSYHFTSTVTVDGVVVLQADGDRVGDGVRMALAGDAGVVNYVITADGSWVMPDGGEWEQLDSAAATSDPITALVAPTSVTVAAANGSAATLLVTVPAPALGLAAGPDVSVTCELTNGQLHQVRFDSVVDGKPATVTGDFGPVVDPAPVVAPV